MVYAASMFWKGSQWFCLRLGGWFPTVPKVLVACTLLVTFLDVFSFENKFTLLDFYAGAGRLARGGRTLGLGCNSPQKNEKHVNEFQNNKWTWYCFQFAPEVTPPAHSTLPMLSPMHLTSTPMLDSRSLSSQCGAGCHLDWGKLEINSFDFWLTTTSFFWSGCVSFFITSRYGSKVLGAQTNGINN